MCSARLNNTRSPSPHRGPVTGATTPGTQNSGVAQQVRKWPVKHPGGYFDSPEDGAGDAASHATSDAHFPGAGALPHLDQLCSLLDGFSTRKWYFLACCPPMKYVGRPRPAHLTLSTCHRLAAAQSCCTVSLQGVRVVEHGRSCRCMPVRFQDVLPGAISTRNAC